MQSGDAATESSSSVTLRIEPGAVVTDSRGRRVIVRRFDSVDTVLVRNIATGIDEILPIGSLGVREAVRRKKELPDLTDDEWQEALEKYTIIRPLLETRTTALVSHAAQQAGVSVASIYRWLKDFERDGVVTSLLRKRRKDNGTTRLTEATEKIVSDVITGFLLTTQQRNKKQAYREVVHRCRQEGIEYPSYKTFWNRVSKVAPKEFVEKRLGKNAALRYELTRGTVPNVDTPYSVIQIDHTLIDVLLVDEEHRFPIGRPWITMAIDVYSRMVAGYYISFDPPGTLGTGICIANVILPKEQFLAQLGIQVAWPCVGMPRVIHVDNAKEFRGNSLRMACNDYGIDLVFRKIKRPNYGGHIERYLGTLSQAIHSLPGSTFSDKKKREAYNAERHAAMTLKEFERWLAHKMLGMYHYELHSELGMPPIKRYVDGIVGSDTQPAIGNLTVVRDEERLRIDFLPIEYRTIQSYGVAIDGINYFSDVLRRWVNAPDPQNVRQKRKFLFRRDPRDISSILFYDPDAQQYFRVPYQDTSKPPMSLWELRAVQKHLADEGKKAVDQDQIFRAYEEMRRIEEQAKSTTRKVRLANERRRRHRPVPKIDLVPPQEAEALSEDIDLQPFEEIEKL